MKKRWYPKLRHPWAQSAAGFTLVELVVVIAIMGILAGVGTVGYSGYVKSAQKKADQALVANIVRAIEVGTNSTMFVPPESLAASVTTYPIGFIVLNAEGGKTVTSNSAYKGNITDACEFSEPVEVTYVKASMAKLTDCSDNRRGEIYSKEKTTISYCLTHSAGTLGVGPSNTYATANKCNEGCGNHTPEATAWLSFDASENFVESIDTLYTLSKNGKCTLAANPGLVGSTATSTAITSNDAAATTDSSVLSQAVRAAFGDSANLALQYDGWGAEENSAHDYSTFYAYAPNMMTDIKTTGQTILDLQALQGFVDMGLTQHYDTTEEMVGVFANEVVSKYKSADAWVDVWMDVPSKEIKNGFGLSGRENYSAARLGYNRAFISYLEAKGASDACIDKVKNYVEGVSAELGLPLTVCNDAFDSSKENNIVEKFGSNTEALKECQKFYDEYKNSATCRENGRTFYNTMTTIKETYGAALDTESTGYESFFDYYDSYLTAMSNLYKKAEQEGKTGILIAVTMENGVVKCDVSPSAADLRIS